MAAYAYRTVITKRHEYVLHAPAHWSEVDKAVAAAQQDRETVLKSPDVRAGDVVITSVDNDEIIIGFFVEEERK